MGLKIKFGRENSFLHQTTENKNDLIKENEDIKKLYLIIILEKRNFKSLCLSLRKFKYN